MGAEETVETASDLQLENPVDDLLARIRGHEAHVGVIGLGYVGLPLVQLFCAKGFPVTGFDLDPDYVELARTRLAESHPRPTYRGVQADEVELPGIEVPEADHTLEHFQARAHREGKKAQDIAETVLVDAGFEIVQVKPKLAKLGLQAFSV